MKLDLVLTDVSSMIQVSYLQTKIHQVYSPEAISEKEDF